VADLCHGEPAPIVTGTNNQLYSNMVRSLLDRFMQWLK